MSSTSSTADAYYLGVVIPSAPPPVQGLPSEVAQLWEVERLSGAEELWDPAILGYIVREAARTMMMPLPPLEHEGDWALRRIGLLAAYGASLSGVPDDSHDRIVGYVAWEDRARSTSVLSCAVHPDHRRQGLATWLVHTLADLLQIQMGCQQQQGQPPCAPTRRLLARVREGYVAAQLFLKKAAFKCYKTKANHYDDPPDGCYFFERHLTACYASGARDERLQPGVPS